MLSAMTIRHRRALLPRSWPAGLLLALAWLPACAGPALHPPVERPHVLFLLADDLQWDALSALGDGRVATPHLDRLVARGTAFTNTYNQGSIHGAVCIPSRTMILTGRHLWRRGEDSIPERPLWSESFAAAGYHTFATGKWHNGAAALERGFATVGRTGGGMLHSTPNPGPAYERPKEGDTWTPDDTSLAGHWLEHEGRTVHSSALWVDETLAFLEDRAARDDDRPFFAHVAFHAPHDPRQAPTAWVERYPPHAEALPPNALAEHPFDQGSLRIRDEVLGPFPRTADTVRLHRAEYHAITAHLDAQIGRLLEALDAHGLTDETLIVFAADHGLAVGQHGLLGKQSLYEHSTKAPLVLAGPGVPVGARRDDLVYLHSLFATTGELAGVPTPDDLDGPSLVPQLLGEQPGPATLYAAYRDTQRMVRDERWKLLVYPGAGQVQLFDLERDPWETTNRAGDPDLRPTLERLAAELLRWMEATGDGLDPALVATPWQYEARSLGPFLEG